MKRVLFLLFAMAISFTAIKAQSIEELRASAEKLLSLHNESAALGKYGKILEQNPKDYDALWNTSFLLSKIGNRLEEDQQRTHFTKARELAGQAIEVNGDHFGGYFAMSVALGRMALISSARERVAASKQIKVYAQTSINKNGSHAGSWDVLGRWHLKVANLSFAERAAANVLFGGAPQGATNENAEKCFKTAIKFDPDYVLYYRDLAEVYLIMERYDDCRATVQKGLALKSVTEDDEKHKKDMREFLDQI